MNIIILVDENRIIDLVKILEKTYFDMIDHAIKGLPLEVCGYLAGIREQKDLFLIKHYKIFNIKESPIAFEMDPQGQLSAFKQAKKNHLSLLACYHSHPQALAEPSLYDIKGASDPCLNYIIISLLQDEPCVRSFWIRDGRVDEASICIIKNKRL